MFIYPEEIIGLNEKIIELTVDQMSASRLSFTDPDFNATNVKDAIKEVNLKVEDLSATVLTLGEKVENATTYSTDEKIVGKWVDGSPIYEKTFSATTPSSDQSAVLVDITTLNIKKAISLSYVCDAIIAENNITQTFETADAINLWVRLKQPDNTQAVAVQVKNVVYQNQPIIATLRYLKNEEIGG